MRGVLFLGFILIATSLMTGPFVGAEGAPSAMFFTGQVVKTTDLDPAAQDLCGTLTYASSPAAPAAGKAYGPPSYVASGCPIQFEYTASTAFTLSGSATVFVFLGCDLPSVSFPAGLSTYRGHLQKNHKDIASATLFGGSGVCVPDTPEAQKITLDSKDTEFAPGDVLTVMVYYWRTNPATAAKNVYYMVGGTQASRLEVLGLPAATPAAAPESLALTAAASSASAAPGDTASYSISIANKGSGNASYELSAQDLPDGFAASFDTAKATAAAGATNTATLSVSVPADAEANTYQFSVLAKGANGGNATLDLSLEVQGSDAGTGASPTPKPKPSASGEPSEAPVESPVASGEPAQAKSADEGKGIPSLGATGALVALLGTLFLAGRVRRRSQ